MQDASTTLSAPQQRFAAVIWQRFRRHRPARWSACVLLLLAMVALLGDFIANEKPLYCRLEGRHYFPVLRQYAVDAGLASWEARFFQKSWREQPYEAVLFPPIPYSAGTIDSPNSGCKGPFSAQRITSWRYRHWLGTDRLGHDIAAGMIAGARVALLVGLIAMSIATLAGILLGALAGYFREGELRLTHVRLLLNLAALFFTWFYGIETQRFDLAEAVESGNASAAWLRIFATVGGIFLAANLLARQLERRGLFSSGKRLSLFPDLWIMRLVEVLDAIPGLLLLLAFLAVVQKSSVYYVMVVIGLLRWTGIARYMRAELLKVRSLAYVEAARAMGFSTGRILFRHALPNAIGPVLISVSFGIASAILLESSLSFLGLGVAAEGTSWGKILSDARDNPAAWWLAVFPGGAIFLTVTAFNLIGEGLTRAYSPE